MHAFLITGDSTEYKVLTIKELVQKLKAKQIPFTLQKIEDARELKKFVKFSFSEKTAIIIDDIDKATPEASNAFLKNLEEPNNNLVYILTASNLENVLPTIVSRCQVIKVLQIKQVEQEAKDFLDIKDRGEAIEFLKNIIRIEHINNNFKNQQNYLNTIKNLKANGNVSLQLLNLVVKMSNHG